MKKLVFFVGVIGLIIAMLVHQQSVNRKVSAAAIQKANDEAFLARLIPHFSAEKRADKFGLVLNGESVSSFDYDQINLAGTYPVLTKGREQYIFISDKLYGPFSMLQLYGNTAKVKSLDGKQSGFIYRHGYDVMFDYPDSESDPNDIRLHWVINNAGEKGLISDGFAVPERTLVLPLRKYLTVQVEANTGSYAGMAYWNLKVKYITADSFGLVTRRADMKNRNYIITYDPEKTVETKLSSILGAGAKIISVNSQKNAIVSTKSGYGMLNIDGFIIVPTVYPDYQESDSSYIFSNTQENLKVDLSGGRI